MKKSICLLLLVVLLFVGCASGGDADPETVTVRETVISEVPVTVEVTKIVEVVNEVEVTRVVEVEIERVVTATPEPEPTATATPEGPRPGSVDNPYPLYEPATLETSDATVEMTILEVITGDEAYTRIETANQFNDPPPEGMEYIMMRIQLDYVDGTASTFEMGENALSIVTNGRILEYFDTPASMVCCIDPDFDVELLKGGTGEGWAIFAIVAGDENPLLKLKGADIFFALTE